MSLLTTMLGAMTSGGGGTGNANFPDLPNVDLRLVRTDGTTGNMQDTDIAVGSNSALSGITQLTVDNIQLDANTITTTTGDLNINANGSSNVLFNGTDVICGDPGTEGSGITVAGGTYEAALKVSDLGGTNVAQFIIHRHSTTLAPFIVGSRSNSNTTAHATVVDGQELLGLVGVGWDGTDYEIGARIDFEVDGTPGNNDMPGRIVFEVTPDGSRTPAEAMRISQDKTTLITGTCDILHTAGASDEHALEIDVFAAGNGDVKAVDIVYDGGALAAGTDEAAILVNINESDSVNGEIAGLEVLATAEGGATINGYIAGINVNPLKHLSGTFGNVNSALVNAVDRTTEFNTSGSNVTLFVADNDTVTIGGGATKFEEIEVILATVASQNVNPTFEYSTGVGTWATFSPVDGTNGFRNTGVIAWLDADIPSWAVGTGSEYLIRITRTRNNLTTSPVEDLVQIGAATLYEWDKNADLTINSVNIGASQAYKVGGVDAFMYATGTLSNANLTGMYATPVQAIAAPGSGKAIIVKQVFVQHEYGSAAFTGGGAIVLQYGNTANGAGRKCADTLSADVLTTAEKRGQMQNGQLAASTSTDYENVAAFFSNETAAFATGDGTATYSIWYSIIDV